jgi:alpha-tubulin suppressor-like RCC1 family protein
MGSITRLFLASNFVFLLACGGGGGGGTSTPPPALPPPAPKYMISGAEWTSLALKADGTVWGWANNDKGQAGVGGTAVLSGPTKGPLSNVIAISGGSGETGLALKSDGTVWSWGRGINGELGRGSSPAFDTSVLQIGGLSNIVAISMGNQHAMALKSDGTVWAWGDNFYGELGDGTTTNRNIPVQVPGLASCVAIAANGNAGAHSMALKSDGTVWTWGHNANGQLGDGTSISFRTSPIQVPGLNGVTKISAGRYHCLALKSNGTAVTWGYGGDGELGNGASVDSNVPVAVSGLSNIVDLAAAGYANLALLSDGTLRSWGGGTYSGCLGDASNLDRNTPVTVVGLGNVSRIGVGSRYMFAIKADGTVWAWGENLKGQLADGTTTDRNLPVQVGGGFNVLQ